MTTPVFAGIAIGAGAYAAKFALDAVMKSRASVGPGLKAFYKGGFQAQMTRREALLILGVREHAKEEVVKDAHRKIMIANHPDAGGSSYLATKINEAKTMLLGGQKSRSSAF